jgi:DNA-binding NarL/FixJ family response regulator
MKKNPKSRKGISKFKHFTDWQFKVMNALIEGKSYSRASELLNCKEGTLRAITFSFRSKYNNWKSGCKALEEKQRLLPRGKRYFTG